MRTVALFFLGIVLLSGATGSGAHAAAVRAELVTDINTEPGDAGSAPRAFTTIAGKVYFRAYEPATGTELYASDGVSAQPQRVLDLARGPGSSNPTALGMAGTRLILAGDDGFRGQQIWALDTLSGERTRLTSANSAQSGDPRPLASAVGTIGNLFIFSRYPEESIWVTDGTLAGTERLIAATPGTAAPVTCMRDGLLIAVRPVLADQYDIVASDGTAANTRVLARVDSLSRARAFGDGTYCHFVGLRSSPGGSTIWRSDGTTAGTVPVYDTAASVQALAQLGPALYVAEVDATQFYLRRLGDIDAVLTLPLTSSLPAQLIAAGGRLVLVGPYQESLFSTQALFVSDGTAPGTQRLARPPDLDGYHGSSLRPLGKLALLSDGSSDFWSLDPVGATFTELPRNVQDRYSADLAVLGDMAVLPGTDARGEEVWRTDGTAAGTGRLHDVWLSTADGLSSLEPIALALDEVLLFADAPAGWLPFQVRGLWRSDGTAAGTRELPRKDYDAGSVVRLARFGAGTVFATSSNNWPRSRLYSTDGELAAATLHAVDDEFVPVIQPVGEPSTGIVFGCEYTGSGNLCGLRVGDALPVPIATDLRTHTAMTTVGQIGNVALFFVRDSVDGARRGLWRSDGTLPGTFRISVVLEPAHAVDELPSQRQESQLLFHACVADTRDCGIYASDATAAGTRRLVGVSSPVFDFAPLDGRTAILLYGSGTQLLISDGTSAGTQVLRTFDASVVTRFAALGGHVIFGVAGSGVAAYWYVSDGSTAGTRPLALPAGFTAQMARPIALNADMALLPCTSDVTGAEFCASRADGSDVRFALDAYPGPRSSFALFLAKTTHAAYFALDDGSHGNELWRFAALPEVLFADDFE